MKSDNHLYFYDSIQVGEYRYFSAASFNGLFRGKMGNSFELLNRFQNEGYWEKNLHRSVFCYENHLFFIPMSGRNISVYDIEKNDFTDINFEFDTSIPTCYIQSIRRDDTVLLIPNNIVTPFGLLDLRTRKVHLLDEINHSLIHMIPISKEWQTFAVYSSVDCNGIVYIAVSDTNQIIGLEWGSWDIKIFEINEDVHLKNINLIDDSFFLTCGEHKVLRWTPEKTGEVYDIPKESNVTYPYLRVLETRNGYLLISGREDVIWKIDKEFKKWIVLETPKEFHRVVDGSLLFFSYEYVDGNIIFFPRGGNGVLIYNELNDSFTFVPMRLDNETKSRLGNEWAKSILGDKAITYESEIGLENYISAVIRKN